MPTQMLWYVSCMLSFPVTLVSFLTCDCFSNIKQNSVGQSPVSIATDMDAVGLLWALDPENYRDDR